MSVVFFFKHKTAYEMRISDWSSDVCSSDLLGIDRIGIVYRERTQIGIKAVLGLLRHREGAGQGELDRLGRMAAHELRILSLDRWDAADRTRNVRHRAGVSSAVYLAAVLTSVAPLQRLGQHVRIAFATSLAIAQEAHSHPFLSRDPPHC